MHFYYRAKTNIYIYADGKVEVENNCLKNEKQRTEPDLENPHLVISLNRYFTNFISDETKAEFLSFVFLISEVENQILRAVRRGKLKELSVLFIKERNGKRVDLITKNDGEISTDKIGQFIELISTKKNMTINVKARDGKVSYYQIEDRKTVIKA